MRTTCLQAWLLLVLLLLPGLAAAGAPVSVLVSIRPLALLAEAVGGDQVKISVLLPPDSSPHHFALRPSQRQAVTDADLVFWGGPALERPLVRLLRNRPGTVALMPDAEHENHAWLSPAVASAAAAQLLAELQRLNPDASAYYQQKYDVFRQSLATVEQQLATRLAPLNTQPLLLDHDYLDVFWQHFGLRAPWVLRSHAEQGSGAGRLRTLLTDAARQSQLCYLRETGTPPDALARQVARHAVLLEHPVDVLAVGEYAGYTDWLARLGESVAHCLEAAKPVVPTGAAGEKKP